ncbi:aminoglycoside phosphotransferase [Cereibacter sphaeroides]|uniref:aminoglycoside phosphotransferase family protein n=1 Tax=Cereibacter sphaeroides TaxID=1063 RepID=UPI000E5BAAA4|nr:phosphotransferase [Cereibacter sphaeroides]RHZ96696.1 aminoglycoside phosphotransferase [Cereibacter sphaeroides]
MADPEPSDRAAQAAAFLAQAGWGAAERRHLAGDASDRRYERLRRGAKTAVLMDAPPGKGDDPAAFVAIATHLGGLGLSPPAVLAQDLANGFLLLEDLGDGLFARLLERAGADEADLYAAATDVLVHLQRAPAPAGLPDLSAADWARAAAMAPDWYARAATGAAPDAARITTLLEEALLRHADGPRVLILRDYHAENLLWLPDRAGLARVGLLDFQLAQMGQPGYDLVSLLQDARRDVPEPVERAMIARFAAATGAEPQAFGAAFAVLGAQRALRILGIFARLCLVAGKPGYVALIPRVWGQLWRNLRHPALAPLAEESRALLPEPAPAVLERIRAQCGRRL